MINPKGPYKMRVRILVHEEGAEDQPSIWYDRVIDCARLHEVVALGRDLGDVLTVPRS